MLFLFCDTSLYSWSSRLFMSSLVSSFLIAVVLSVSSRWSPPHCWIAATVFFVTSVFQQCVCLVIMVSTNHRLTLDFTQLAQISRKETENGLGQEWGGQFFFLRIFVDASDWLWTFSGRSFSSQKILTRIHPKLPRRRIDYPYYTCTGYMKYCHVAVINGKIRK